MLSKFASVPAVTQPFYDLMLSKMLQHHRRNPHQLAMFSANNPTHKITWLELYNKAHYLASFLSGRNFGRGQIGCVVLPNCWQLVVSFFGAILTGGAVSFTSILFTESEIAKQIEDSSSTVVITDLKRLKLVLGAAANNPRVKTIICVSHDSNSLPSHVFSFDQATTETSELFKPNKDEFSPDDLLFLPFSSGTTNSSKGVLLTHESYGTATLIFSRVSNEHIYPKINRNAVDDYNLLIRPINHPYGFMLTMRAIIEGVPSILIDKLELHSFCKVVQEYRIKQLYLVPGNVISLATDPEISKYDLSSVRLIVSSAETCSEEITDKLLNRHPNIHYFSQGYGMTEAGAFTNVPFLKHRKDTSSGLVAPNFEEKIMDLDTNQELKLGGIGEVWIRGPMMKGYLNRPRSDAFDEDGWFHTGDIGYFDEDECLHIVDRVKHIIKVGGVQVAPAELENLLLSHPKVREAAVVGVKDAQLQEKPKAFIVKNDESVTAEEIQEFMKGKVAAYKQLTGGIEFKTQFPRTHSGKVHRRFLVQQ